MSRKQKHICTMKIFTMSLSSILLVALSTGSFGQSFRVKAGLNLSNVLVKDDQEVYSDKATMKPGFHVGASYELPINDIFSVETSLLLTTKGFKYSEKETNYEYKETQSFVYVDIPIIAKASFNVGENKIYGALGPYLGIGISGKAKYEETSGGSTGTDTEVVNWGSGEDDDIKRLDFGLAFCAGYEMGSVQIGLFYNLGLANCIPNPENGLKMNHKVLGLSLGYRIGEK